MTSALDYDTRVRLETVRRECLLALPPMTLIRCGWEIRPGEVQGSIYYRIGNGLGPCGRDDHPEDVLRREIQRSHMPHEHQHWNFQILARPVA